MPNSPPPSTADASAPAVSFIIPAHNEQGFIVGAIESIRTAGDALGEPYEIIVVDDHSTDATAELARQQGASVVSVALRHIAAVRNAGARQARGRLLIFVDADTRLTRDVLTAVVAARRRGYVGGGAVVGFDKPVSLGARLGLGSWNVTSRLLRWAAGCFMFATREAFDAAGGFDELFFASEEIHLSAALRRQGPTIILPTPVLTSARKLEAWSLLSYFKLAVLSLLTFGRVLKRRDRLQQWYGDQRER